MNVQKTGSLIATIRKEQNRTQQDLANELGVSSAAISKWERGIGFPDVSLIEPLATSLGITIAELFKGEKAENNVDHEYESLLSDVVKVSANEISKKKKITNWIIAITVAIQFLSHFLRSREESSYRNTRRRALSMSGTSYCQG